MKNVTPHRHRGHSHLVLGVLLLAAGTLLLLLNLGLRLPEGLWRYYPVLFLALGVLGLVSPNRHLSRSSAVWFLATGIYCLVSQFHVFGLSWGSAWPIFVICAGFDIIFDRGCAERRALPDG